MPAKRKNSKPAKHSAKRSRAPRIVRMTLDEAMRAPNHTDFARLDRMTDEEITRAAESDPDALPFTDEMFEEAEFVPAPKATPISIRVDPDVLEFFRSRGPGYQSRMNAVLRTYMKHATKKR